MAKMVSVTVKTKKNKQVVFLLSSLFFIIGLSGTVNAGILTVCSSGCNYNSIQLALDSAVDGDTIYVYNGLYKEHIVISNSLTLEGENRNNTIIDGSRYGTCIQITANNTVVAGLGIKNCQYGVRVGGDFNKIINNSILINEVDRKYDNTEEENNYGIYVTSPNTEISGNIVQLSNNVRNCGICSEWYYNNVISNNEIKIKVGNQDNYGIFVNGYNFTIINNIIASEGGGDVGNRYSDSGIVLSGSWTLTNNLIYNNTLYTIANITAIASSPYSNPSSCRIRVISQNNKIINNTISNNYGGGICIRNSNNTIADNAISNNEDGIILAGSYVLITNNSIVSNRRYGASIQYSANNTISGNDFRYNKEQDIILLKSSYNKIENNKVCKIDYTETNLIMQ